MANAAQVSVRIRLPVWSRGERGIPPAALPPPLLLWLSAGGSDNVTHARAHALYRSPPILGRSVCNNPVRL